MAKRKSSSDTKTEPRSTKGRGRKSALGRSSAKDETKAATKPVRKATPERGGTAPTRKTMSERDREFFRQRLLEMRERLTRQIASLTSESLQRPDNVNSEEDGTDAFDRQFALNLASSENESVHDIEEALGRIEEGTYGLCDECGAVIERSRLEALPFVRTCIKCQSEKEKRQGPQAIRRFF